METEKYAKELEVAVRVVHVACALCGRVQERLFSVGDDHVMSKDDDSPVTVADLSVQATISWLLSETFGSQNVSIVAEEDTEIISKDDSAGLLAAVVATVNESLASAPKYGLQSPETTLETSEVLKAIGRCSSTGGPSGRHWVLDPVDGTLGFVRGDQYAVALAMVEDGKVVLGVLGCPNYPVKTESLDYHYQNHETKSNLASAIPKAWGKGCVLYASKDDPALATLCEPVEKANSNHSFTAGLAHSVGLRNQPMRVHSMVKYAAIARGDAEIFMKFARSGYKEKIWDHAAGVVIVEEAGGVVTDAGGRLLDFSKGIYLEGLDRGIIACSGLTLHDKLIAAVYASWDSSNL
ncbi:hypothetical protein K1719_042423 [Acacia pycnantha]|nr:hypothetical protein K1719_042423 [Acacia pycnantha]